MYYGIISDIHSNEPALTSVLDKLDELSVDTVICLGDIVGYASQPSECIELTKERSSVIVVGNHDSGAVGTTSINSFNELARKAIKWTEKVLRTAEIEFLNGLPLTHDHDGLFLVHASPFSPSEWHYVFSANQARKAFKSCSSDLIFVGHTHRPAVFSTKHDGLEIDLKNRYVMKKGERCLINVGSVGQPRDGDPRASFATFRSDKRVIEFHRTTYDVKRAQESIKKAGLPMQLAWRLSMGY
jgi:putative phosphoesterase